MKTMRLSTLVMLTLACVDSSRHTSALELRDFGELFVASSVVEWSVPASSPIALVRDVVLWGGHWIAVDLLQSDLKVFDKAGRLVAIVGRPGDGPGEFRLPVSVSVLGDGGWVVYDAGRTSVSIWQPNLELVGAWRLAKPGCKSVRADLTGERLLALCLWGNSRELVLYVDAFTPAGQELGRLYEHVMPAAHSAQVSLEMLYSTMAGDVLLLATRSGHIIHRLNLRSGDSDTVVISSEAYEPPSWSELRLPINPSHAAAWERRQEFVSGVFALSEERYVLQLSMGTALGFSRYVVVERGRGAVTLTRNTTVQIVAVADHELVGLELLEGGGAIVTRYRETGIPYLRTITPVPSPGETRSDP